MPSPESHVYADSSSQTVPMGVAVHADDTPPCVSSPSRTDAEVQAARVMASYPRAYHAQSGPPNDEPAIEPARYEGGAWTLQSSNAEKKSKRTWAKAAGRTKGSDSYRFGDCTRALVGCLGGKKDRGWKEAAGREGGSDSYKFGDVTRIALTNLFGDKHRGGSDGGMGTMPTPDPLFRSTSELGLRQQASLLDGVWLGFFNSSYAVGRLALGSGEISIAAVEDAEPAVLLGLPSLAALECAIRSAHVAKDNCLVAYDGRKVDGLALNAGAAVDRARGNATASREALALFDTLLSLSQRVAAARLSAAGLATLRARSLAMSGTDTRVRGLSTAEEAEVNGLLALSQSVATRVSQMPMYKQAFNRVLDALGNEGRHEADMTKMMSMSASPAKKKGSLASRFKQNLSSGF